MTECHGFSLETISTSIETHGIQWVAVTGSETPRWVYSVGLTGRGAVEVVLAGSALLRLDDVVEVLRAIDAQVRAGLVGLPAGLAGAGWTTRVVDPSWTDRLLLSANAFYGRTVEAIQLVPPTDKLTFDIPDLSECWSPLTAPAWSWVDDSEPWPYRFKRDAMAFVDRAVLRGTMPRTAGRWDGDWEVFSLSDDERANLDIQDAGVVSLATLIATYPDLAPLGDLQEGETIRRTESGRWEPWN